MSMSLLRRVGSALVFLSAFYVDGVLGKGGRGKGKGSDIGDAVSNSLDLPPDLTAVFAITIVFAIITLFQLGRAGSRFKKFVLPEGEPTLPYDVGLLFRVLLFSYLVVYLLYNILYAIVVSAQYGSLLLPGGLGIGSSFVGQLADVLFFATLLSIITYRQRIQLNPREGQFNLKSFLDGWILATILILGIGQDAVAGSATSFHDSLAVLDLAVAFQVFILLASIDVAISAFMARARLAKAGIQDKIIWISAFLVSPAVLIGAIYRIISIGLTRSLNVFIDGEGLLIAGTVIGGLVSIFVVACCLLMGAPPQPPKSDAKDHKG